MRKYLKILLIAGLFFNVFPNYEYLRIDTDKARIPIILLSLSAIHIGDKDASSDSGKVLKALGTVNLFCWVF